MTIRFTCAECSSVLKIKDELAGSTGRCPKCKTKFVVPDPPSDDELPSGDLIERPTVNSKPIDSDHIAPAETTKPASSTVATHQDPSLAPIVNALGPSIESLESPQKPSHAGIVDPPGDYITEAAIDSKPQTNSVNSEDPFHLQLDDDDEETAANAEHSATIEKSTQSNGFSSLSGDDLNCPPMLVLSTGTHSKSLQGQVEPKKAELPFAVSESPVKIPKPTTPRSIEAFDPMKFLMDDAPAPSPISFSTRAENDSDLSLSDDSDDEIPSRPTPQPLTRRTPIAPTSRPTPEKVDLATAAKMMKKAIKESQADAVKQREIEAKGGFDYTLFFREFGLRGLAILACAIFVPLVAYYSFDYVLSSRLKLPKLGYVTGTVKLDGKPLAGAMVQFEPTEGAIEGSKRERARTSVGLTDDKGFFRMMYSKGDNIEGVAAGKCHVWVNHVGEKGSDIPAEWTQFAMRYVDVTVGSQKAPFDINLESKKVDAKKK